MTRAQIAGVAQLDAETCASIRACAATLVVSESAWRLIEWALRPLPRREHHSAIAFCRAYGLNVSQYQARWWRQPGRPSPSDVLRRVWRARTFALLVTRPCAVSAIADHLGYSSQQSMDRFLRSMLPDGRTRGEWVRRSSFYAERLHLHEYLSSIAVALASVQDGVNATPASHVA